MIQLLIHIYIMSFETPWVIQGFIESARCDTGSPRDLCPSGGSERQGPRWLRVLTCEQRNFMLCLSKRLTPLKKAYSYIFSFITKGIKYLD